MANMVYKNVPENTTAVDTVYYAGAGDYRIISGVDASKFNCGVTSGVITFKTAPDYENPTDYGKNNVYEFVVRARVSAGGTILYDWSYQVTVTDVDETAHITGVRVGGAWKVVNGVWVNIGGTWKAVNRIYVNVDGYWK